MQRVDITPDGCLLVDGRPFAQDPLILLGEAVTLEEGFTLGSWFRMIQLHTDFVRLSQFLPALLQAAAQGKGPMPPDCDRLELVRTVELVGHPGPARLDMYTSLIGVHNDTPSQEVPIKHIPPASLWDAPFRLGRCRHMVLGDRFAEFVFETVFTLFELIEAVAWQLSFHGASAECALRR
ncbi:hypothetical protein [Megalodesulfovibrio gigas]|uniref:Uncharacterized protein n=1 Tax=Megalodesulfovibrio gigas (strain ATCC 19364 / DSM 1382 / NCIMB 9332 / VKM B-1759) TaxID=1121448 RepID=T2GC85_MEGG1|nr:hypothetical protein [Megalodesulfovibrio gigas]AGW13522.1 hypothetical protein DGI_1705 [Megalodesulfovibrio gigas DSM 1382 = ATCC 19364]